jgi:hypothetical protein
LLFKHVEFTFFIRTFSFALAPYKTIPINGEKTIFQNRKQLHYDTIENTKLFLVRRSGATTSF